MRDLSYLDLTEALELFNPRNDISVLAALWNGGPTNRQRALALADEDCRRAQAPKENTR